MGKNTIHAVMHGVVDSRSLPRPYAMINISTVSLTFGSGPTAVLALDDLSLRVQSGTWVSVIGSNGSGKSTLLGAIAGALRINRGRIEIDGKDVTGMREHRRAGSIGRVFQNPFAGTAPTMTVAENLRLAELRGGKRGLQVGLDGVGRRRLNELVADLGMGLENRLDTPIGLLSGGQRQALTLLMATLCTPAVLLLDEHTAALDPASADSVMELTRRIVQRSRITTLMVTHDMEYAARFGDRVVMMHLGRVARDWDGPDRDGLAPDVLSAAFAELRQHRQQS